MPPAFVQAANANALSVAFGSNNTAGNLLVAICGNENPILTFSDTQNNTWIALPALASSPSHKSQFFYCLNCKAGPNTVSFTATSSFPSINVVEYSGANTLDVSAQAINLAAVPGNGGTSTGPSITTHFANALIIEAVDDGQHTYTAGAGYTLRATGSTRSFIEDQIVSSIGTYAPTFVGGDNGAISGNTLAFYFVGSSGQRTLVGAGT